MNLSARSRVVLLVMLGVILCGVLTWRYVAWRSNQFDESKLRDTQGVEVVLIRTSPTSQGILFGYTIENHTGRTASSIVLTAEVQNAGGKPVAVNPLINVLTLKPGEKRSLTAMAPFLPDVQTSTPLKPGIRATLVRWAD